MAATRDMLIPQRLIRGHKRSDRGHQNTVWRAAHACLKERLLDCGKKAGPDVHPSLEVSRRAFSTCSNGIS